MQACIRGAAAPGQGVIDGLKGDLDRFSDGGNKDCGGIVLFFLYKLGNQCIRQAAYCADLSGQGFGGWSQKEIGQQIVGKDDLGDQGDNKKGKTGDPVGTRNPCSFAKDPF